MSLRKTVYAGFGLALAMATMTAAPAVALEDNQILPGAKRIGHISPGGLEGACSAHGGDYIESSEEYGCATDSGWVYCEKSSGDCVGGNEDASRPEPEPAGPTLPPPGAMRQHGLSLVR